MLTSSNVNMTSSFLKLRIPISVRKHLLDNKFWCGKKVSAKLVVNSIRNQKIIPINFTYISLFGFSAYATKLLLHNSQVKCDQNYKTRDLIPAEKKDLVGKFDWKKFVVLLWPDVWYLLAAIGAAIIAALVNSELPIYLGNIINVMTKFIEDSAAHSFTSEMRTPVLHLIFLYFAQAAATFTYITLLSHVGERLAARMKCELFHSILRQDMEFFDKTRTGELVDCLTTDIQDFKSAFKLCISQGLRSATQIAGCVISLFIVSSKMTVTMLVVVPGIIVCGTFLGSVLRKISRKAQQQAAKATTIGEEAISNIRTVRAFASEQMETVLFQQQVDETRKLNEQLGFGIGLFQAGTNLFLNGLVLGTLYFGGYLMSTQELNAGNLMSFLVATQTIQRSLTQLSLLFGQFVKGVQAGTRAFQFINMEPKIPLTGGKIIPYHSLVADVKFSDVTFAYPTRPQQVILKDFNLSIPAGKTVAIVGASGNGKSTIANLLERFYDVDSGIISLGGINIKELDPSWLRGKTIGLINQEPVLFATSVMENIRYGKPSASDEEVYAAAKKANADEFIRNFPNGYQTVVGERGATVSGGQKQRIAIARALLKNPSVLILDEATSALDAESEKVVQQAIDEVTKNRTVLVIAHRLSTVRNADIIVVLSGGIIVEMGSHDTLLKRKGHYWNLMNQQNRTSG